MGLGLGGFDGSNLRVAADTLGIGDYGKTTAQPGTSFEIWEQEGGVRIVLKDRACPFQEPEFGTEQKSKKTNYPGNPDATIQVLGWDLPSLEIEGEWNYRFLPKTIVVDDDPEQIQTPAQACELFDRVVRSGRTVRVQWLNVVRFGILKKFTPKWIRATDVKWSMTFEWSKADDSHPDPPNLPSKGFALSSLMKTLNAIEDVLALAPDVAASMAAAVVSQIRSIREEIGLLIDSVRAVETLANLPSTVLGAIESSVASIRDQCTEASQRLSGSRLAVIDPVIATAVTALSKDPASPGNDSQSPAAQQATLDAWGRTVSKSLYELRDQSLMIAEELRQRVRPDVAKTVVAHEGETLDSIAAREYGSSSYATFLAHINRLQSTIVTPGTRLQVPSRPYGNAQSVEPTGIADPDDIISLTGGV